MSIVKPRIVTDPVEATMIKKTIFIIALVIALLGGAMASKAPAAETSEGPHLEIYGFVQLDAIYDFDRVDPSWSAALRPSKIPVNCPADPGCGKDGETIFSVRQTRFGVKAGAPTALGELNTKFEFDLFGVGADAGQTTIRLRHAYGELGQFLAGQTNSLFMDGDVFPNTIEYWGPIGMIFFRNLQLRWTPYNAQGAKVSVALEGPGSGVDAGNVNNPEGWKGWNHYPDVTAQFRADQPWGHAQVAGIVRWLGFENPTNSGITKDSGNVIGGGVNVSGSLKTVGKDKLLAQIAYGKGIASYINDCCVDVAPNDALNDGEAVPLLAWLVYYDHYWSDRWSSSVGYSMADQDNTGGQNPNAFH
ncbi:MAG TPA: DcaP family trimeric outer membrane transporter, partial [Nitrospiria bacterium]|nr:DcaP family trimeric outer membrane transporter [Nitrospiria bacterium]